MWFVMRHILWTDQTFAHVHLRRVNVMCSDTFRNPWKSDRYTVELSFCSYISCLISIHFCHASLHANTAFCSRIIPLSVKSNAFHFHRVRWGSRTTVTVQRGRTFHRQKKILSVLKLPVTVRCRRCRRGRAAGCSVWEGGRHPATEGRAQGLGSQTGGHSHTGRSRRNTPSQIRSA